MKLGELIHNNSWQRVGMVLLQLYPDQRESREAYEKVYSSLQRMEPVYSAFSIVIDRISYDEEPGDNYTEYSIDVAGILRDDIDEKTGTFARYAIETEPWNSWLGMTIFEETADTFTPLEIIAHCLYEMTFLGYTEEEIQREADGFYKIMEDFNMLTGEEKELIIYPDVWRGRYEEE